MGNANFKAPPSRRSVVSQLRIISGFFLFKQLACLPVLKSWGQEQRDEWGPQTLQSY